VKPAANIERCTSEKCAGGCEADGIGFYVSVYSNGRVGLLLGPYGTHQEALDHVPMGKAAAERVDARAFWYAYGTVRVEGPPWPKAVLEGRGHGCEHKMEVA